MSEKFEKKTQAIVVIHDIFNICFLSTIVLLDFYYLWVATEWHKIGTSELGKGYEAVFNIFFGAFSSYCFIDTLWIVIYPSSVLSNYIAIVMHHVATGIYILIPFYHRQFSWHMAVCLVVEVNTVFLILRRNSLKGSMLYILCEVFFYITWFAFRCVLFPILVIFTWNEYLRLSKSIDNYVNIVVLAPIFQVILTALSMKWTYEILQKVVFAKKKE
mmetsp:Transcript_33566/g.34193  ORF Transcript_33566/g.34193 Transcript_33566/m.34193 type:complete len:216 (+) Transcript_33566:31-678(+)